MPYVVVEKCYISSVRQRLSELNLLREDERIRKLDTGIYALPVHPSASAEASCSFSVDGKPCRLENTLDVYPSLLRKPYELLGIMIKDHMKERNIWKSELQTEIPRSWVKYGDLILFGRNSFEDPVWKSAGDTLWQVVCKALKVKRLGRIYGIKPDGYRSPKVEIIYGDDSWVKIVDNHIRFTWDVQYCMFSQGNATERFRVAQMNCHNETVVDMYTGIGYFTIPFLVHAKAKCVHACEWNPNAVDALSRNLVDNNVSNRCIIHFGDNREVCPVNIADRVYLGLIPTCMPGIETACKALKFHSGGMLHLHENVCGWRKTPTTALTMRESLPLDSDTPAGPSGTSVTPDVRTPSEIKDSLAQQLPCVKCQEIVAKFPFDHWNDQTTLSKFEETYKSNYSGSFTIKGSDTIVFECPIKKVVWKRKEWFYHAIHLCHTVCSILTSFHKNTWMVSVTSMNHVKSYAPHIDHLVYDLKCSPVL